MLTLKDIEEINDLVNEIENVNVVLEPLRNLEKSIPFNKRKIPSEIEVHRWRNHFIELYIRKQFSIE